MAHKKRTPLNDLDDALGILNGARIAFHPEHFPIEFEEDDIFCEWIGPGDDLPVEIENAIGLVLAAAAKASSIIEENGFLKIVEDHRERWVAVFKD